MNTRQCIWLISGFLAAPLAAALASAALAFATGNGGTLVQLLIALVVVYLFSAPIIWIIGVPLLALAVRFNIARWWVAAFSGAIGGAFFRLVGHFKQLNYGWFRDYGPEHGEFATIGALACLVVWLAWYRAQSIGHQGMAPNNSSKPTPLRGAA
jgi:hypothetical protein